MLAAETRMRKLSKFKTGNAIQYKKTGPGETEEELDFLVVSVEVSIVRDVPSPEDVSSSAPRSDDSAHVTEWSQTSYQNEASAN